MPAGERRTRGLQAPYSKEQVGAGVTQIVLTIVFFVILGLYSDSDNAPIMFPVYAVPAILCMSAWLYCSLVDPSLEGGLRCPCMKRTQDETRFCRLCRKSIPGLDHHCPWLNTCVGRRTYWAFFILATCGLVQMALQVVLTVLLMTVWRPDDIEAEANAYMILMTLFGCISLGVAGSYVSLWGFHVYLLWRGMGTYDWVLEKYAREAEEASAQRKKEAEQRAEKQRKAAIAAKERSDKAKAERESHEESAVVAVAPTSSTTTKDRTSDSSEALSPAGPSTSAGPGQSSGRQGSLRKIAVASSASVGTGTLVTHSSSKPRILPPLSSPVSSPGHGPTSDRRSSRSLTIRTVSVHGMDSVRGSGSSPEELGFSVSTPTRTRQPSTDLTSGDETMV